MSYPEQIVKLQQVLKTLPGVINICSGIDDLTDIQNESLSLIDFGHLPHAAIRRTNGGLQDETLVQVEFELDKNKHESWKALEFLAWWVRDQARSGENLQLRPFGLPPQIGENIQFGQTLKFHIDIFIDNPNGVDEVLEKIEEYTKDLVDTIEIYQELL
jgi:hypothetical protein